MISEIILWYLIAINILAFIVFMIDKIKAKMDSWRISEKTLLTLAVIGGSVGALLGMIICRHKIRVSKFKFGIPAIIVIQTALIYLAGGF